MPRSRPSCRSRHQTTTASSTRGSSRGGTGFRRRWNRGSSTRGSSVSSRGNHRSGEGRVTQNRLTSQSVGSRSESSSGFQPAVAAPSLAAPVDVESEEYQDSLQEVILAIDVKGKWTIGCTYYVARTETMHFMEDIKLGNPEVVESLTRFAAPTTILLSTRVDQDTLKLLNPGGHGLGSGDNTSDTLSLPYRLDTRPTFDFDYEAAKSRLVSLKIGSQHGPKVQMVFPGDVVPSEPMPALRDDETEGAQSVLLKLAGWVNLDARVTVGCAGALLGFIQRQRAARFLPGDAGAPYYLRVGTLEMSSLKDTMFIDSDTLFSLQILQSESHPHLHKQGPTKTNSGTKEGLSVFGLFSNFVGTPQGRLLLRQYFLRPSLNITLIKERLDTIAIFLQPENEILVKILSKLLRSVDNIRTLCVSLRRGLTSGSGKAGSVAARTWSKLRRFCFAAAKVKDHISEIVGGERLLLCAKVHQTFNVYHLQHVGSLINAIVDFEDSQIEGRTVVRPNVDKQLDELKYQYAGIPSLLTQVAKEVAQSVPQSDSAKLNVVYFPQIGYLISMAINTNDGAASWEGTEGDRWERLFSSDLVAYYKNGRMREMDETLGDLWTNICELETEIIFSLAQEVLKHDTLLSSASDVCGELDCHLALTIGAKQYQLARPDVVESNVVDIQGGRHILQALVVSSFVPNDLQLQSGIVDAASQTNLPSILILTGPNNSGKSVYMKQNAIIVYMAHIGCFVPAARARIGVSDAILTRIATRESVSSSRSAFMIDLQQMSKALHMATSRSLLVIDEFGKGTNASDGAGLVCAVLEHLLHLGTSAPRVLAATHYHELFESALLEVQSGLALAHMETLVDPNADQTEKQLTYLYSLKEGRSTRSFGTICAAMNGISAKVVERADQLALLAAQGEDLALSCAVVSAEEEEELMASEVIAREMLAAESFTSPRAWLDDAFADLQSVTVESTYFETGNDS